MAQALGMRALSEVELEDLAEFLSRNGNPDALTFERLDGFLCALIASPESEQDCAATPGPLGPAS